MESLYKKLSSAPAPATENVEKCPLCDSNENRLLFDAIDRFYQLPGKFGIVRCSSCSFVRLSPRPEEEFIGFYYPESDYYSYTSDLGSIRGVSARGIAGKIRSVILGTLGYPVESGTRLEAFLGLVARRVLLNRATYGWGPRFPKFREDGNALDIGCGNGRYLSYLKHHGWVVHGVEISNTAARAAKQLFDIDVHVGPVESVVHPKESFDYITMFHSLEHVFNLNSTLSKIYSLLKPNGILYVEVPNVESIGVAMDKRYWFHWDAPRHLWGFSPSTLTRLCRSQGFQIDKLTTLSMPSHGWSNTYKNEENDGSKSALRPNVSGTGKLIVPFKTAASRLFHLIDNRRGNYICCWMRK